MSPSVVVFDIGGVLVDWQPHLAWAPEFGEAGARAFMDRVDFRARNVRGDNGTGFAELAEEIDNAEDRARLESYVPNYARTIQAKVPGSWEVVGRLRERAVPMHAITNWSAETWPIGVDVHPELGEVFGVTVVSGQEGIMKPDARIFEILCQRAGVAAADCVFIDDGAHNVAGAQAAGMDGIHFTGAAVLELALADRGLL